MTYGIKVSKPEVDVKSATNIDLAFSSQHKHLKIYSSAKITGTSQEITHPFGYPLSFAGYALSGGKYSVQFDYGVAGYQFEVTDYGMIRVDANKLYLSADVSGGLVYILFADKADPDANPTSIVRELLSGIEASEDGVDVKNVPDGKLSLTSAYVIPNIVQAGDVTVSMPAVGPQYDIYEDTRTTDVEHSLGYAAHVVIFNPYESYGIQYYPAPSGLEMGSIARFTEVYIDSSKIRFRVSRTFIGGEFFPTPDTPAEDYNFRYYLTNYRLPT